MFDDTPPFNRKLCQALLDRGYTRTNAVHYDRYDLDGRTIFHYMNDYLVIVESNGEPVSSSVYAEIVKLKH